jgi:hypothetical protein
MLLWTPTAFPTNTTRPVFRSLHGSRCLLHRAFHLLIYLISHIRLHLKHQNGHQEEQQRCVDGFLIFYM